MSAPAATGRPTALRVVDTLVLTGAVVLALLVLLPVYGGVVAIPAIVGGTLLGALAAAVPGWRRWPGLTSVAALVVVYFLFGSPLAVPTATAGADSLVQLAASAVGSWRDALTVQAPLGRTGGMLVVPYLLGMLAAFTAVTIVWRVRRPRAVLTAALVPFVVAGVAMVFATGTSVLPVVVGLVLVVAMLVWASWRSGRLRLRRPLALAALAAVLLAGGVAAPLATAATADRTVLRERIEPPLDLRDFASPLSAFRHFVKEKDAKLVTVSGLPAGATVRLATMDAYDGVVWNVAGDSGADGSGAFHRVGESIPETGRGGSGADPVGGKERTVTVRVDGLGGVWLPTVGDVRSLRFSGNGSESDDDSVRFNTATQSAVLPDGVSDGLSYTMQVQWTEPPGDTTLEAQRAASVELPAVHGSPDVVRTSATAMAGTATTPAGMARLLQKTLSEDGYFSHGLVGEGDYPSLSGHGADRMITLLGETPMVGDDEQYASAMALMARSLGLPARVVLGFRATEEQAAKKTVTFTGGDIAAWVEVDFAGAGWVPFYPTPPETQVPQDSEPSKKPQPRPQVLQPPPPPPQNLDDSADDSEKPRAKSREELDGPTVDWAAVAVVGGSVLLPIAVLLAPFATILAAKRRRRRRRKQADEPLARVTGGWDELLDLAADHRTELPAAATRLEKARILAEAHPGVEQLGAATLLAEHADTAVFGETEPSAADADATWAALTEIEGGMRAASTRWGRLRARYSLASLRRRGRRGH